MKECKHKCSDCNCTREDELDENDVLCYCDNEKSMHYNEHCYYSDEACEDFVPLPLWEQRLIKWAPIVGPICIVLFFVIIIALSAAK